MPRNSVTINKTVHGIPLEKYIAELPRVQAVVRSRANEIEAAGEEVLQNSFRFSGATILRVDQLRASGRFASGWKVTMIDTGENFAGAIEFGRRDYLSFDGNMPMPAWTTKKIRQSLYVKIRVVRNPGDVYGGMAGLHILQTAVDIVKARHRSEFR